MQKMTGGRTVPRVFVGGLYLVCAVSLASSLSSSLSLARSLARSIVCACACDIICLALCYMCSPEDNAPRPPSTGKFVGGGDDTVALAASGELKRLFESA